ncbi:MAG: transporter substrate-binding domain-containing protein [Clostridia bacterium]|nr:transporter substrate-binding domain-containing protein [Clostridia bacterium]
METKFNQSIQPKKKHLLRPGWQERLPLKPILVAIVAVLLLTVLVLINRPTESVLSSAELDVLRSAGVLRVGVDSDLEGLFRNGDGYERAVAEGLATLIFGSTEGVSLVPVDRYAAPWRMSDGEIDLVLMSMQQFPEEGFDRSKAAFFTDDCVLLGYETFDSLAGKTVAVLQQTPSEKLLDTYLEKVEPEMVVHRAADYYSMRVMLRAGTVDAVCVPRSVALSWHETRTRILPFEIGRIPYYAIAKKDSVLLDLCNEVFYDWQRDGTFSQWGAQYGVEWGTDS